MMSNSRGTTMEGSKTQNLQQSLKKGPWTAAEDAILIEYVKKHGEGNWNSVQKNLGLMRCGKSCRLRWANHLRPNLKQGSFTLEEERIIIELHAELGNKWARMASQLPGRTDNEIKNFWNTRMKKRQRAGLPICPQEFHEEPTAVQRPQYPQKQSNSSSSSSFSSLISSRKAAYDPSLPLIDSINFSPPLDIPQQNHFHNPFFSNSTLQFKSFGDSYANNVSLALPLSPVSQYARSPSSSSSSLSPLIGQSSEDRSIPRTPPLLHYNNVDFDNNMSFTSLIMGARVEPVDLMPSIKSELPSNQTPPGSNTPSGGVCLGETSSKNNENDNESAIPAIQNNRNSGLLDALLLESHNLLRKEKLNGDNSSGVSEKGKRVVDENTEEEDEGEEEGEKEVTKRLKLSSTDASGDDMSSSQSSIGMKPSEEPMEEMNSMDDDLLSLLDNFPSSTPLPEWYRKRNVSDDTTGEGGREVEAQQDDSSAGAATTHDAQNVEWGSFGSLYWNNVPSIC